MKKPRKQSNLHIVENQPPTTPDPAPTPPPEEKKERLYLAKFIGPVITGENCRYVYKHTFNNKWTGKPMFTYELTD